MVRRSKSASFMRGTFVFPGGSVDPIDTAHYSAHPLGDAVWRAAALRELAEEADVWITAAPISMERRADVRVAGEGFHDRLAGAGTSLAVERLVFFSNWVTPMQVEIRFDARFYAVDVPAGTEAVADGSEVFAATWATPALALKRAADGEWNLPIPTEAELERFAEHDTVEEIMADLRSSGPVPRIEPRIVRTDAGEFRVIMPGEPGFADATDVSFVVPGADH